ncbi:MAG: hypothetical protein ACRD68_04790, partial [Pyrinomonadaceae bacterium]
GDEDAGGRLVFVGYGIRSSQIKRDDFKGIDVRGKVVVLLDGPPREVSEEAWKKADASFIILRGLVQAGAAAVVVAGSGTEQMPYAMFADYMTRRQIELADSPEYPRELPPFIAVSDSGAEKLFAGSGTTYAQARAKAERGEFASQDLKRSAKIKLRFNNGKVAGSNVIGFLEGADAKLREEAVVYTAHYDA